MTEMRRSNGAANVPENRRYDFNLLEKACICRGLQKLLPYIQIAREIILLGNPKRSETIAEAMHTHFEAYEDGMAGFLLACGLTDPAERVHIAKYYAERSENVARRRRETLRTALEPTTVKVGKASRIPVEVVVSQYQRLPEFIKEGIENGRVPHQIAEDARYELGISCTVEYICNLLRSRGGAEVFLRLWHSKDDAVRIAASYSEACRAYSSR